MAAATSATRLLAVMLMELVLVEVIVVKTGESVDEVDEWMVLIEYKWEKGVHSRETLSMKRCCC